MRVSSVQSGALGKIELCDRGMQSSPNRDDILIDEEMGVVSRMNRAGILVPNADAKHNTGDQLLVESEVFAGHDLLPWHHLVRAKQASADILYVAMQRLVVHNSRVHRVVLVLEIDSSLAPMHGRLPLYYLEKMESGNYIVKYESPNWNDILVNEQMRVTVKAFSGDAPQSTSKFNNGRGGIKCFSSFDIGNREHLNSKS
ncbi:hypothetical protein U9M48_033213 [Paspalum notatum var. saurae]|uniref:Uncharacterized protein n=1 Tax=Paspalum notatum var. saurae TaxID=547442 RepID=A0AAQ3U7R9_PASNO